MALEWRSFAQIQKSLRIIHFPDFSYDNNASEFYQKKKKQIIFSTFIFYPKKKTKKIISFFSRLP